MDFKELVQMWSLKVFKTLRSERYLSFRQLLTAMMEATNRLGCLFHHDQMCFFCHRAYINAREEKKLGYLR